MRVDKRWGLLAAVSALVVLFFALDLGHLLSLATIKSRQAELQAWRDTQPVAAAAIFFAVYVAVAALSLPGAAVMTLAAGALFGLGPGAVIVSFASTLGATLAFLGSRYLFRDAVARRFADRLESINRNVDRDGPLYLFAMRLVPFIPFFALKDFGQMLVFSGAYATLYLVAVRRWPQLLLFVGSVVLVGGILVAGSLPQDIQAKVPLLPTLSKPVQKILPSRIQQRFHLWLDGFNPPPPDVDWWKKDYEEALDKDPKMKEQADESPAKQQAVNTDIWFDRLAFQPAQAVFGLAAGGTWADPLFG